LLGELGSVVEVVFENGDHLLHVIELKGDSLLEHETGRVGGWELRAGNTQIFTQLCKHGFEQDIFVAEIMINGASGGVGRAGQVSEADGFFAAKGIEIGSVADELVASVHEYLVTVVM
jgi:hypothetical protein